MWEGSQKSHPENGMEWNDSKMVQEIAEMAPEIVQKLMNILKWLHKYYTLSF